jgi:hypothetical protein
MAPLKHPGPTCQTKDCFGNVEDGTLARMPSPPPSPVGSATPQGVAKKPPRAFAHGKCSFLNPQSLPTVVAPQEAFDLLRKSSSAAKISQPVEKAEQEWPDKSKSSAIEEEVQIGDQKIKVIRPTENDAKGKNLPTTQQLAEALRAVPAQQRAYTNQVIVSPNASSVADKRGTVAGEGSGGVIYLYPVSKPQSQNSFDNRVTHESGHNLQEQLWKDTGAGPWQAAADADTLRPSPYAAAGYGEDFCEFNILYNTSKGTSCETIAKQIYPNRWKKREEYTSP